LLIHGVTQGYSANSFGGYAQQPQFAFQQQQQFGGQPQQLGAPPVDLKDETQWRSLSVIYSWLFALFNVLVIFLLGTLATSLSTCQICCSTRSLLPLLPSPIGRLSKTKWFVFRPTGFFLLLLILRLADWKESGIWFC
jgi:hypothetical protein